MSGPKLTAEAELDISKFEQNARKLSEISAGMASSVDQLIQAMPKKAGPALAKLREGLQSSMSEIDSMLKSQASAMDAQFKEMARGAGASGKRAGSDFAKGLSDGGDTALATARALKQKLQAEYDQMSRIGKVKLGALENLKVMGVSINPEDSLRLKEALGLRKLNTDATQQAFNTELKLMKEATEIEKSRGVNRRVDAAFEKQVALEASRAVDAASKNVIKNAAFEKKSLEERLVLAKLIREVSSVDGVSQDMLRSTYGTKAVWASQNVGKVLAKVELAQVLADTAQTRERQIGVDRIFYSTQESMALKAAQAMATAQMKARDLNAQFMGMSPAGQYARASRVANIAQDGAGADYAAAKFGTMALDASSESGLAALREQAVAAKAATGAIRALGDDKQTTAAKAKMLANEQARLNTLMREGHSAARGLASGFGAMWLTWGSLIPILAGAALSNSVVQAVKLGAEVGQSLAVIQHLGGASTDEIVSLNRALLETASSGPFGPVEVAKALETLALAGLSAKEQISALKPVLDFAVAGNMPIEKAAESLVAISTAFGYQAQDMRVVSDLVAKTAAVSMSTVEGMSSSFKIAATIAQQYNASLIDVSASLGLLANVGIKGTSAGTAVKEMYNDLIGKSKEARSVLKETLNFSAFEGVGKSQVFKPMTQSMEELSVAFIKLDLKSQARVLQTMAGERGAKGFATFFAALRGEMDRSGQTSTEFVSKMRQMYAELEDAPGFSAIAAIGMSSSTQNQLKETTSVLQSTLVEAFQAVEPSVLRLTSMLQGIFGSAEFKAGVSNLVSGFATVVRIVLENIGVVTDLVKWIGVYAAATAVSTIGTGLLNSALVLSARSAAVATLSFVGLTTASTAVAGGFAAVNAAAGIFGLLAIAATAAYTAYKLFSDNEAQSSAAPKGNAEDRRALIDTTIKGLDREIERLDTLLQAGGDERESIRLTAEASKAATIQRIAEEGDLKRSKLELARVDLLESKANWESFSFTKLPIVTAMVQNKTNAIAALDAELSSTAMATAVAIADIDAKFNQVSVKSKAARDLAESRKRKGAESGDTALDETKKLRAHSELQESTRALTSYLNLLKLEQMNADKEFANTDAINKRSIALRGFATEAEAAATMARAVAKSESQYHTDVLKAATDAGKTLNDPKSTAGAKAVAQATLTETLKELEAKQGIAVGAATIANLDSKRNSELKIAADIAQHEKVARGEEATALRDALALTKSQNDLDAIGRDLSVAQAAEATRVFAIKAADLEYEIAATEALAELDAKRAQLKIDSDNGVDTRYGLEQSSLKYVEAFNAAAKKRNTMLATADMQAAITTKIEYVRVSATVNGLMFDALFDGGKGGADKLRLYLEDELLRKPFKMIIKAVLDPITGSITNAVMGSAGGTGILGAMGSSALGTAATGYFAGTAGVAGNAAMATLATGEAASASAAAVAAAEAGGVATSLTGAAATLGSTLTAALPWVGGAIVLAKLFGGSDSISAADSGRARIDYAADGTGGAAYSTTGTTAQIATMTASTNALAKSYFDTAKSLGISAIKGAFEVGANTGKEGAAPNTVIGANFGTGSYSSGEISSADSAALALASSRAILTALQASELPGYLASVFNNITASTASQDQITATLQYAQNLKTVRDALLETRTPLQVLQDSVSSTFAELGTSADTFKKDFVSAIDAGLTPDALAKWQSLDTTMQALDVSMTSASKAIADTAKAASDAAVKFQQTYVSIRSSQMALGGATPDAVSQYNIQAQIDAAFAAYKATDRFGITNAQQFTTITQADLANYTAEQQGYIATMLSGLSQLAASVNSNTTATASNTDTLSSWATDRQALLDQLTGLRSEATASYVAAQKEVTNAQMQVANVLKSTINTFQGFIDGLDGGASPLQNLRTARATFGDLGAAAGAGDESALAKMPAAARAYLDLSKRYSATAQDYRRDEAGVRLAMTNVVTNANGLLKQLPEQMQVDTGPLKSAYDALTLATNRQAYALATVVALNAPMADASTNLNARYVALGQKLAAFGVTVDTSLAQQLADMIPDLGLPINIADEVLDRIDNGLYVPSMGADFDLSAIATRLLTQYINDHTMYQGAGLGAGNSYSLSQAQSAANVSAAAGYSNTDIRTGLGNYLTAADAAAAADALHLSNTTYAVLGGASVNRAQLQDAYDVSIASGYTNADIVAGMGSFLTAEAVRQAAHDLRIPGFAVGTNYVPQDMLAQIHQGEAIIPAAFNPERYGATSGNDALVAEIKALREEVKGLRAEQKAGQTVIAKHTESTANTLAVVTRGGRAIQTEAFV